jgi:hypothetical protein
VDRKARQAPGVDDPAERAAHCPVVVARSMQLDLRETLSCAPCIAPRIAASFITVPGPTMFWIVVRWLGAHCTVLRTTSVCGGDTIGAGCTAGFGMGTGGVPGSTGCGCVEGWPRRRG